MANYENDIMVCPFCGSNDGNTVYATERSKSGYVVRTRECKACLQHWRTYEVHAEEFRKSHFALIGLKKLVEKYGGEVGNC